MANPIEYLFGPQLAPMVWTFLAAAASFSLGHMVYTSARRRPRLQPDGDDAPDPVYVGEHDDYFDDHGRYEPSTVDVLVVKVMLEKTMGLPPELLDTIIDFAEYWAHSDTRIDYGFRLGQDVMIHGSITEEENRFLIRSPPIGFPSGQQLTKNPFYTDIAIPAAPLTGEHTPMQLRSLRRGAHSTLIHPVRRIVFKIRSHDQGWGGGPSNQNTFTGSWTWFEAGLERLDASQQCDEKCELDKRGKKRGGRPAVPLCALRSVYPVVESDDKDKHCHNHPLAGTDNRKISKNRTANRTWQDHTVVWSWDDGIAADSPDGEALVLQGRGKATGNGEFVRNLKLGDVVTVWGCARFPGWSNSVQKVGVKVYWAL